MHGPCKGCQMRCVGCHGQNEDGTWRCEKYGAYRIELKKDLREMTGTIDYKSVKYSAICRALKNRKGFGKR